MSYTAFLRAAMGVFVAIAFVPPKAEAKVRSVKVKASRDYEPAAGYTYAEITIEGTVRRADGSVGRYSVPAVLIYPRHGHGNRVGVVDWLNSAFYHFFPPTREDGTIQFTLLATGNYLFEKGYTYLSIQWNKKVTETFGAAAPTDGHPHNHLLYGSIERSADAWEVLRDAARLLKDPSDYPDRGGPKRVTTVLSSGYSQGGALQLEMLAEGLDPTRVYDGHLVQMIGLTCWKREDALPHFGFFGDCRPLPTGGHAPVIVLPSETDMLIFHPTVLGFGKSAFFTRNRTDPNWRQYEMAGISHLPKPIFPVDVPNQNTADARPIFRAALQNLTRWTHGPHRVKPPASRHFLGSVDATDVFIPTTDADGHFAGGLRLPHVESTAHGRRELGAPLGRHRPLNPLGENPLDPFKFISGTFARFTDPEIVARYVSRDRYVRRVKCAADALAAQRYITPEDRNALFAAAKVEPLPLPPVDDDRTRRSSARPSRADWSGSCQRGSPLAASTAVKAPLSSPKKTRPPAVASVPPQESAGPICGSSQAISPVWTSIARRIFWAGSSGPRSRRAAVVATSRLPLAEASSCRCCTSRASARSRGPCPGGRRSRTSWWRLRRPGRPGALGVGSWSGIEDRPPVGADLAGPGELLHERRRAAAARPSCGRARRRSRCGSRGAAAFAAGPASSRRRAPAAAARPSPRRRAA